MVSALFADVNRGPREEPNYCENVKEANHAMEASWLVPRTSRSSQNQKKNDYHIYCLHPKYIKIGQLIIRDMSYLDRNRQEMHKNKIYCFLTVFTYTYTECNFVIRENRYI